MHNKDTHNNIQNVVIITKQNESNKYDIEVLCLYAAIGSTTLGCFMVAMYLNRDTPPMYRAIYRQSYLENVSTFSIKGNITGIKLLNFYEIEADLFPGQFPAYSYCNRNVDSEYSISKYDIIDLYT